MSGICERALGAPWRFLPRLFSPTSSAPSATASAAWSVPALFILIVTDEQQVATLKDVSLHLTTNTNDQSGDFLHKLYTAAPSQSPAESTMGIIAEVVTSAPLWSAALAHVVEFYLGKGAEMKPAVVKLCADDSSDADKALLEYIYEALRTCCCWYGFCGRS
jgi:hypothetical protein